MSDPFENAGPPSRKDDPQKLVLRGRPHPVARFRRGLIVGVAGAVAATLVALSWFALEPPGPRKAASPTVGESPPTAAVPDALADAPKSYGDVPRLGPPLPGDLGRPILEHERSLASAREDQFGPRDGGQSAAETGRERLAAASAAARSSPVIVQIGQSEGERGIAVDAKTTAPVLPAATAEVVPISPGSQQMIAFAHAKPGDIAPDQLQSPFSPFTLAAVRSFPRALSPASTRTFREW